MSNERKIKIIRIVTRLNIGGPSFHTILLTSSMNRDKYDCKLLRGSEENDEGNMDYFAAAKNVKSIRIPEMSRKIRLWKDLKACYKLFKIIKREKPDIVHTHLSKAGFIGRLAAIFAGDCIIVHTFHGHTLHGYWGKWKTHFFSMLEKYLACRSNCLIAVSDKVRNDLIAAGIANRDNIITVHLGLELDRFRKLEEYRGRFRKELGVDEKTVLIGSVARLVPVKNHKLLIDAACRITAENVKFVIIGDGELRQILEKYANDKAISEKFIFTGFRNDLEIIYSDLDISILSSLNEGLPVAVIESMAAGVPVISTDVGGIRELIEDNVDGFVVHSRDSEMLADRLEKLIADKELRLEFGKRASNKVFPYFNYDRLVRDISELYNCLVEGRSFKHLHMKKPDSVLLDKPNVN